MQDPWVVDKKFGSFPSNFFMQPFQYSQIVNLVDCLSTWYKFVMNSLSNIRKKSAAFFCLLIWTDGIFLVVGNWQSSIVHFVAVMTRPKMSPCLSKRSWQIVTLIQAPTFSRRHTKTHADSKRCHSERDSHRSTTTQLWNSDMSMSSNHTKAFFQCCHGKHTVASSRT